MTEPEFEKCKKSDLYQVFLFSCPANLPFSFARHPWFVVHRKNSSAWTRYEVVFETRRDPSGARHLFTNLLRPTGGISVFPYWHRFFWRSRLAGMLEGDDGSVAARLMDFIERSIETYPYKDTYALRGPNSNTYAAWILARFPESGLTLPGNSYGKRTA